MYMFSKTYTMLLALLKFLVISVPLNHLQQLARIDITVIINCETKMGFGDYPPDKKGRLALRSVI